MSAQVVREWRWVDEPTPMPVPGSWTKQGKEPAEDDEEHWYAVACKFGTQLLWSVDEATGDPVDGPHGEDRRVAVVYARSDCARAVVCDYRAERVESGWRPTDREFVSVRSFAGDAGGVVSIENQQEYLAVLEEHYGLDPSRATAAGGESA